MVLEIIYEDKNILVINKPAGILVHPTKRENYSLIKLVLESYPEIKNVGDNERAGLVHRLDKEVSGILLIAKNQEAFEFFRGQFERREISKKYILLVEGKLSQKRGIIRTIVGKDKKVPIRQKAVRYDEAKSVFNPKEAITRYQALEILKNKEGNNFTLVEAVPETGRTHQLRIHFQYLKHSIVGDRKYGAKTILDSRIFLHASYLKVKFLDGQQIEFKSPLPKELDNYLKSKIY